MTGIVIVGTPLTISLPAQQVLTVTADALSSGVVYPFSQRVGDTAGGHSVASSATVNIGPFGAATRYQIDCASGSLAYSSAPVDYEAPDETSKGAIGAYTAADVGTVTLLAAAREARVIHAVVHVTTVFADGDGAQPTLLVGQTGDTDAFAAAAVFTDAADESKIVIVGTLDADKALLLTQTAGTGTTETGAYTVSVIAAPLA